MARDPQLGLVAHGAMGVKYRRIFKLKKHETITIERKRRSVVFDHGIAATTSFVSQRWRNPAAFLQSSVTTHHHISPVRLIEFQISVGQQQPAPTRNIVKAIADLSVKLLTTFIQPIDSFFVVVVFLLSYRLKVGYKSIPIAFRTLMEYPI